MSKFGTSQSVPRKEDMRFLVGTGRFMEDVAPAGALHAVFFRSPVAHGRIDGLDLGDAASAPGVVAVYAAADLDGKLENAMDFATVRNRDGTRGAKPRRPMLADDRVCHAGEAIAMVVAETKAAALDAMEMIGCDFERSPGAHGDRRGRADDPPRGAGERRLRLVVRRRGRGRRHLRARRARHPARADRQPGDGDADGGARLLRRMGRHAAACRLLRPGGLGAEGRADREARPAGRGGAGDDARRRRRLRDQGLHLPGVLRSSPSPPASSAGRCTG